MTPLRGTIKHVALLWVVLGACRSSPLPDAVVIQAAEHVTALGHPQGEFLDAEIVASSTGRWFSRGTHDRYVDVRSRYRRRKGDETMTVRFYVHSTEPCKITTDVLADTGPPPILLDNALASAAIGEALCDQLANREP